jgi:phytoene dehydrogenase-like protein
MTQVVVVGGGHNGLVCACHLARAGLEVLVVEAAEAVGGGTRTVETVPGYHFDTHSVAHNIIRMTDVAEELDLGACGLEYLEMDPFAVAFFADGAIVRFSRDVEATVASIAAVSPADAEAYRDFVAAATPLVVALLSGVEAGASPARVARMLPGRLRAAAGALARNGGPAGIVSRLLAPYGRLLVQALPSDRTRAPVSAFAAHASAGPDAPGSGMFALWQAAYHRYGQWHARGGGQGLTDALVRRLASLGGHVRTAAPVARVVARDGTVQGVVLEDGERLPAQVVVTAMDPRVALLDLLDPPLSGPPGEALRRARRGNAVQMVVHVATDRLPPYPGARPGDWNGLQSHVDSLDALAAGFAAAEARRLPPDPVPTYAFTTSALDTTLAPPGHHTVYLACPTAPFAVEGGWDRHAEAFAERMIDQVERRAPGFRDTVRGVAVRTPERMAAELRWPGAHPMYLDVSLDQLAWLRPTPQLAGHATPVRGLFVSGAGTAPVGGVAGTPGRAAARAVLARHGSGAGGPQERLRPVALG